MPRQEYATLNAIRGVAALAVVLVHATSMVGRVAPRGYLAVDLFFSLSGFVIAHAYGERLATGLSFRSFVQARALRFWPLYALGLALGAAREGLLIAAGHPLALSPAVLSLIITAGLLFVPFPVPQRHSELFPLNVPSWSLLFELLVNVLYGVVRPWLGPVVLAITVAVSAAMFVWEAPVNTIEHVGVSSGTFALGIVRTILSFTLGLLIHRLGLRGWSLPVPLLLVAAAAAMAVPWGGLAYDLSFVLVLSPLIVILGASTEPSEPVRRVPTAVGLTSFPLYAIHRPLLAFAEDAGRRLPLPLSLVAAAAIIALIILSYLLAIRFDAPVRRRIKSWVGAPPGRDLGESAAP